VGRTVLPYSQVLEREYNEWKKFRRGLRKEDQKVLDRLFDLARPFRAPQGIGGPQGQVQEDGGGGQVNLGIREGRKTFEVRGERLEAEGQMTNEK